MKNVDSYEKSIQAKTRISYKSIIKKTSGASKNSCTSYDTSMLSHGSFIVVRVMVVLDVFVVVEVQCSAPTLVWIQNFLGKLVWILLKSRFFINLQEGCVFKANLVFLIRGLYLVWISLLV